MKVIYQANDGTEFFNENECIEYENELRAKNGEMPKMWDNEFNIITDLNDLNRVCYINAENNSQAKTTRILAEYYELRDYLVWEGLYCWNNEANCWLDIEDRLFGLHNEIIELEGIKAKMWE